MKPKGFFLHTVTLKAQKGRLTTQMKRPFLLCISGLQFFFCQHMTMMCLKHFQTLRHVIRLNNHMSLIGLCKGIHILNENLLFGQVFQYHSQRAGHIGTRKTNHIGRHHGKVLFTQYFHCLIHIRHNQSQNTEIAVSAILKACILIPFAPKVCTTSLILPSCFPRKQTIA